jgi:hypothetical protein
MLNNSKVSRDTFLSALAAELYGSAPESFNGYLRKNPGKNLSNYAYTIVYDSVQYKEHRFTEAEADIIIDKIIKMLKARK